MPSEPSRAAWRDRLRTGRMVPRIVCTTISKVAKVSGMKIGRVASADCCQTQSRMSLKASSRRIRPTRTAPAGVGTTRMAPYWTAPSGSRKAKSPWKSWVISGPWSSGSAMRQISRRSSDGWSPA